MGFKAGIVTVDSTLRQFEDTLLSEVYKELGDDKGALKAFEVCWLEPKEEERQAYIALGHRVFIVKGALGLNDGGENWRMFNFQMEEGLPHAEDLKIAKQLASQCKLCVRSMRKEGARPSDDF